MNESFNTVRIASDSERMLKYLFVKVRIVEKSLCGTDFLEVD